MAKFTIGFGNSLFSGDGSAGNILKIESTCTITRRFKLFIVQLLLFVVQMVLM